MIVVLGPLPSHIEKKTVLMVILALFLTIDLSLWHKSKMVTYHSLLLFRETQMLWDKNPDVLDAVAAVGVAADVVVAIDVVLLLLLRRTASSVLLSALVISPLLFAVASPRQSLPPFQERKRKASGVR